MDVSPALSAVISRPTTAAERAASTKIQAALEASIPILSLTFVDDSIAAGELQDQEAYNISGTVAENGPAEIRKLLREADLAMEKEGENTLQANTRHNAKLGGLPEAEERRRSCAHRRSVTFGDAASGTM
eukprot:NODE_1480_length_593_cov_202.644681_g1467_i0.p1 GENE.NODE_1480_length_593_cov_202.644681_g1467_i0~~NODE_1480_length_593_cov_202.644681_g1467_i0.p1  ORF type:complete len:142 (+),score=27.62 NODE_1480_length_593_cov_202.644681_g1467_i0:38-427(+)